MLPHRLRSRIIGLCLFLLGLASVAASAPASATEPLKDQIVVGALGGHIFPSDCCWVPLPPSERLRAMKHAEFPRCSAIGGPVGVFELRDRKLWLTGLFKCSGAFDHREVYPELASPAFASWLSGSFTLALGPCGYDPRTGAEAYARKQRITVEQGVVRSVTEQDNPAGSCQGPAAATGS
jgi:hypothetical protein